MLIDKIGLEETETATSWDLLDSVVSHAKNSAKPFFSCHLQSYGAAETFETEKVDQSTVWRMPRFFLVGNVRMKNRQRMTTTNQHQLVVCHERQNCSAAQGCRLCEAASSGMESLGIAAAEWRVSCF